MVRETVPMGPEYLATDAQSDDRVVITTWCCLSFACIGGNVVLQLLNYLREGIITSSFSIRFLRFPIIAGFVALVVLKSEAFTFLIRNISNLSLTIEVNVTHRVELLKSGNTH